MAAARKREADPPTQLSGLAQTLKTQGLPRATLLRGEERFFVERGVRAVVDRAREENLEVCKHDAADPEFSLPMLLDDLIATPMFAAARCVLVRNVEMARQGVPSILAKVGTKPSPFTRAALSFINSQRPGCLIISGKSVRADHALAKAIKAIDGPILSCRKLWDTPPPWDPDPRKSELAQWVGTRSRELDMRLSPDDCAYIATAVGNDLAAIDTQLEQVRAGGQKGIREQVEWASGGTPWKAADELLGGNASRGISAVESLFRSGFHSDRDGKTEVNAAALSAILLGTLRSKSRQTTVAARARAQGASPGEAAEAAGATAKMARESVLAMTELRAASAWQRLYKDVLELERRARSGPDVDVNDFVAFALRHRMRPAATHQRSPSRGNR
ncbi:MAG: DNA polymerase III delta subunit [Candidatus Paceibacteria bacterium]|jgi:DNA polymerase III delta subunit